MEALGILFKRWKKKHQYYVSDAGQFLAQLRTQGLQYTPGYQMKRDYYQRLSQRRDQVADPNTSK